MNAQLMEMWGRWMGSALKGQNQMDMMNGWWLNSLRDMTLFNKSYTTLWGLPTNTMSPGAPLMEGWQQAWESVFKMQQLFMQWMEMVPKNKYDQLAVHAEELEKKIKDQAKNIDRLRQLLSQAGGENNVVVTQLQDLIGQQSEQFKQMTQSMSSYIKSSTEKVTPKK